MTTGLCDSLVFERIRAQSHSSLANQKQIAVTLIAIESTIKEQNEQLTDLAYFGALMTVVSQQCDYSEHQDYLAASMYLLAITIQHVPTSVLRLKYDALQQVFTKAAQSPTPAIAKSCITCVLHLLVAQDTNAWNSKKCNALANWLFSACVDCRPKVRKLAQESVKQLIEKVPPPHLCHPALGLCIDTLSNFLDEDNFVPCLQGLIALLSTIQSQKLNEKSTSKLVEMAQRLIEMPLELAKSGNMNHLQLLYSCVTRMASSVISIFSCSQLGVLLQKTFEAKPDSKSMLVSDWVTQACALTSCFYSQLEKMKPTNYQQLQNQAVDQLFALITEYISKSACKNVIGQEFNKVLNTCVTINGELIVASTLKMLKNITFKDSWGCLLTIAGGLIENLQGTEELMQTVMEFRDDKVYQQVFPFKDEMDQTIVKAMKSYGLSRFFQMFPLNILESSTKRPYLLVHIPQALTKNCCAVGFFTNHLVTLGNTILEKATDASQKVYETLFAQIWDVFIPLMQCSASDLSEIDGLINVLGKILQSPKGLPVDLMREFEINLKQRVCVGLTLLIQSNPSVIEQYSEKLMNTLLNEYCTTSSSSQFILGAINAFLGICKKEAIDSYYGHLLKTLLQSEGPQTLLMMDLLIAMMPFISIEKYSRVTFATFSGQLVTQDATLQKKSYKGLCQLVKLDSSSDLLNQLTDKLLDQSAYESLTAASRKSRMELVGCLIQVTQDEELLHRLISSLMPEIMLSTKESNEKTRIYAFETLELIKKKMSSFNNNDLRLDTPCDHQLSLKQYILMVLAGLAGETASMQSAAINCLSVLIHDQILDETATTQIIETVLCFTSCKQTTKAVLGFIKVTLSSVQHEWLHNVLDQLVECLFKIEGGASFKMKIRQIVEKLMKKWGDETIEELVPENHRKLIANIIKRRASKTEVTQDSDEDDDLPEQLRKSKISTGDVHIRAEGEQDDVMDFMDSRALSRFSVAKRPRESDSMEFDSTGRLLLEPQEATQEPTDFYKESIKGQDSFVRMENGKIKFQKTNVFVTQEPKSSKKQKIDFGQKYKSSKAQGDVKRKGMPDPFAYLPLDKRMGGTKKKVTFKQLTK